jgi:hypothetical protein
MQVLEFVNFETIFSLAEEQNPMLATTAATTKNISFFIDTSLLKVKQ